MLVFCGEMCEALIKITNDDDCHFFLPVVDSTFFTSSFLFDLK